MDNALNANPPAADPGAPPPPPPAPGPPAAPAPGPAPASTFSWRDEDWTMIGLQLLGVVALFTATHYFWWKKKTAAAQVSKQAKQISDLEHELDEVKRSQKKAATSGGRGFTL